jgi:hypothetical protein
MTELTKLIAKQIIEDKFDICQECPKMKDYLENSQKLYNDYCEKFDPEPDDYTFWDFCCDKENEICNDCEHYRD